MKISWRDLFKRLVAAPLHEKARALLYSIRTFRPPFEMRYAVRWIDVIDSFVAEVHVVYEVDHTKRQMVVTLFTGLPGQGR